MKTMHHQSFTILSPVYIRKHPMLIVNTSHQNNSKRKAAENSKSVPQLLIRTISRVFVFPGPWPGFLISDPLRLRSQFELTGPQSKFLLTGPQPSICIYRPWLIKVENNKNQRLHIMSLFLFLLFNSFVTVIGCSSLLLFLS